MHVDHGTARIAYDAQGDGAPVLLLHAGVTDRRSWAPLVAHLGPGLRTIAYDRRGFGETTYRAEPHVEREDALAVLDAEAVDAAVVIGASNGGRRALDLALTEPDRVAALVLVGAGIMGAPEDDEARYPAAVRDLIERYEAADGGDDLDLLNRIEAHAWLDGWTAPEGRVAGPARDLFLEMNAIALAAPDVGPEAPLAPQWDRLGEITVPTLVLWGEHDLVSTSAGERLATAIPGARSEVLRDTAHLPHLEGHERTLHAIAAFLAEVT